ncbi:MAG TPA: hypothetical protein PKA13_16525 [Geminicoccaceae bacterium]|nr:hypothetical protein [Geminicoccus sp.]HMU51382.1 hypothetical protein [Geminicoccaceae bacterium]
MGPINLQTFKQAISGAGDDAALRLGQNDDLKTAKHGLGSRLVRFMFGPTKQDRADNKHIVSQFLKEVGGKYGMENARQALQMARPGMQRRADGLYDNVMKPLTARQARDAIAFAKSLSKADQREAGVTQVLTQYAPGSSKLNALLAKNNVSPEDFTAQQHQFFSARLADQVAVSIDGTGQPPAPDDLKKFAKDAMEYTLNLDDRDMGDSRTRWDAGKDSAASALKALALSGGKGGDGSASITDFLGSMESLMVDTAMGQVVNGVGGQDIAKPIIRCIDAAIRDLSPQEARKLYEKAMAPDGGGRLALFAAGMANTEQREAAFHDPSAAHKAAGATQISDAMTRMLIALGERAGIKEAPKQIQDITNAGLDVDKTEVASGLGKASLQSGGIDSGSALGRVMGQMRNAVGTQAEFVKRAEEADYEAMERAFEIERRLEGPGKIDSGLV